MSRRNRERGNSDNPAVVGADKATAQRQEEQVDADLRWLLTTPQGRRLAWYLVAGSGRAFDLARPAVGSSEELHYQAGRRDVGLVLMERMQRADPAGWFQVVLDRNNALVQERADRQRAREAAQPRETP